VKGRRPITREVALRLAAYLDVPAIFWMRMQKHYDEWQEHKALLRGSGVDGDTPSE
jgi:plasmid maintenance system antidote protein VapI